MAAHRQSGPRQVAWRAAVGVQLSLQESGPLCPRPMEAALTSPPRAQPVISVSKVYLGACLPELGQSQWEAAPVHLTRSSLCVVEEVEDDWVGWCGRWPWSSVSITPVRVFGDSERDEGRAATTTYWREPAIW